ncbi:MULTISPECIES: hypothetical protein [unclassified Bradyrhizobium]|uniref:hypothetical protein n=1 Tax=unclassified Bradyrhizobium TaxID=2631580 RepID=UPI0023B13078|nr:hypothetical protein [Bradyrhizobium sp. CSS354]MDE5466321.1 hypothetical protein [Bradyrhizobium sp. CSS354]
MSNAVSSGAPMTRDHTDGKTTPNRRVFLATAELAAASCATFANAASSPPVSEPDPVFQAIEAHKRAREGMKAAVDAHCALARQIVGAGVRLTDARTNDQRIEVSEDAMLQAFDVETNAACKILNRRGRACASFLLL